VRYSANGNRLWTRIFGDGWDDAARSVSAAGEDIYVAGATEGSFGGQTNPHLGWSAPYLVRYDAAGHVVWTRIFGGTETWDNTPGADSATGVAADSTGAYVSGNVYGEFNGQGQAHTENPFVRRFATDGSGQWTRILGQGHAGIESITEDRSGVYGTGTAWGGFGGQPDPPGGQNVPSPFVVKFDVDGRGRWARIPATAADDEGLDIAVSRTGIYVSGLVFDSGRRPFLFAYPAPEIHVVGTPGFVRTRTVDLMPFAVNAAEMEIGQDKSFAGSSWVPYKDLASMTLAGADGSKKIYFRTKDSQGTISAAVSTSLVLDRTPPRSSVSELPAKRHEPFAVSWSGSDATSGFALYQVQFKY
jgi:hypothetical protein